MAQRPKPGQARRKSAKGRRRTATESVTRTAGIVDDGPVVLAGIVDDGATTLAGIVDDDAVVLAGIVDDGPIVISGRRRVIDDGPLVARSAAKRTGRKLVLLPMGDMREANQTLWRKAGLRAESAQQTGSAPPDAGGAKIFQHIGVAICSADPDQASALARAAEDKNILAPEDEYMLYAANTQWLRGYRDAVNHISERMLGDMADVSAASEDLPVGTGKSTWGVVATRTDHTKLTGKGVRIAVLDTGIDPNHPDFGGRLREAGLASFISGETVADGNGHGTHCAGVACGAMGGAIRYGVATGAELFVAKVLSNLGEGPEQSILQGIDWAMANKCRIISMSLSAQAPPSPLFNQVGKRALEAGTLLIAAAGNDSNRPVRVMPVGYPANSDNILAVAALDQKLRVARFSNAGSGGGGQVDIAGPGVGVYSAWPGWRRYKQESGTSMATPFVAGITALLAEAQPDASAETLLRTLRQMARKLDGLGHRDVGAGLVQAPA